MGELSRVPVVVIDPEGLCSPIWGSLSCESVVVHQVASARELVELEPWRVQAVCVAAGPFCEDTVSEIRACTYAGPVLVVGDRARGLASLAKGADDFVGSDVSMTELRARLVAIRRRSGPYVTEGLVVDPLTHRSWVDGRDMMLRRTDAELLLYLAARAGRFVPASELVSALWPDEPPLRNALDVAIHRIRQALGTSRALLETRRRSGYRLRGEP